VRDSNPRWYFAHFGFQDRCIQPDSANSPCDTRKPPPSSVKATRYQSYYMNGFPFFSKRNLRRVGNLISCKKPYICPPVDLRLLTHIPTFLSLKNGSTGRTRTCDRSVNSRLLYQLSYCEIIIGRCLDYTVNNLINLSPRMCCLTSRQQRSNTYLKGRRKGVTIVKGVFL
jgi:hypothetical protein